MWTKFKLLNSSQTSDPFLLLFFVCFFKAELTFSMNILCGISKGLSFRLA